MRIKSIVVLGGTGFLGTRLVARLIRDGHRVTVLSRDREQHKHLLVLPGLSLENCDVYEEAQLSERFRGKDVVINLVGILNERGFGGAGFRRAHTELTRVVLQSARSAGVERLLQVTALKASPDAPSYYLRSKGEAEKLIRDGGTALDWTLFQPSVMFGPGDSFLNRFAGLLASVPWVLPLARPNARFQPVLVDDVIEALCRCLDGGASSRRTFQLGGPQVFTLREIVALVGRLTGRRRWILGLPDFLARIQAAVMNLVPGRPFSSDNYRSLKVDSVCTEDGFARLGIKPQSMPASARAYLGANEDNARLSRNRASAGRSIVPRL
ncbi:MAG TPA: complex I NDUFA9 subunit family protein [Steroidobacteraceae bacterium]|jgi:NADH dehydrogenase|nr:complex I NDUFA9 subunit family protein [Steroidobacteraceae bacterium]